MTEENQQETPVEVSLESEPLPETKEDCLPCQALDHLCEILPEEEGKKACEAIKIGLENDTMTADEAREMLASKVGRHVLATKLAEVSEWITEQETKRQERVEQISETIPLEDETPVVVDDLPPLPEEMTMPIEEIAPIEETIPELVEEIIPEIEEAKDFVRYNPDDAIIYKDLFDTTMEDDPAYMYDDGDDDDEDEWLQDGLIDDE
jgi:hypothetical protein